VSFDQRGKKLFPTGNRKGEKKGTYFVPQIALSLLLFKCQLKERTAQLLNLINQKGQHHQHGKVVGQIVLSVSIIVLQVVALVLQRVKGLVFNLPACPSSFLDVKDIFFGDVQIGDPGEMQCFVGPDLPIFDEIAKLYSCEYTVGVIQKTKDFLYHQLRKVMDIITKEKTIDHALDRSGFRDAPNEYVEQLEAVHFLCQWAFGPWRCKEVGDAEIEQTFSTIDQRFSELSPANQEKFVSLRQARERYIKEHIEKKRQAWSQPGWSRFPQEEKRSIWDSLLPPMPFTKAWRDEMREELRPVLEEGNESFRQAREGFRKLARKGADAVDRVYQQNKPALAEIGGHVQEILKTAAEGEKKKLREHYGLANKEAGQRETPNRQKPANENPMEILVRREEMMKEFRRQVPPGEDLSVCDTYSAWLKAWKEEHGEAAHLEKMEAHQEFEREVDQYLKNKEDTQQASLRKR